MDQSSVQEEYFLSTLMTSHALRYHLFADDMQRHCCGTSGEAAVQRRGRWICT